MTLEPIDGAVGDHYPISINDEGRYECEKCGTASVFPSNIAAESCVDEEDDDE